MQNLQLYQCANMQYLQLYQSANMQYLQLYVAMCDLQFYQVNKFDLQHDQGANILGSSETDFLKFI